MNNNLIGILIAGLVFMAIFPTLMNSFTNPTWYVSTIGNNATYTNATGIPYPTLYNTIMGIVPLLIVVGLLYYVWSQSGQGKKGIKL